MRRAWRSTRRCLEMAGRLDLKFAAKAPALAGPARNRSRIARRVGSAMARNTSVLAFAGRIIRIQLVTYHGAWRASTRWRRNARELGEAAGDRRYARSEAVRAFNGRDGSLRCASEGMPGGC